MNNIRERMEENELTKLSKYATKSVHSIGREREIEKCTIRTDFQRDRDRIVHSKAFRRLMHKTQVFISPRGDHYRTRLSHTLEVSQISRTISKALMLNEDLTESIALGHDLGHTPFGHSGEDALNQILKSGFKHNEQSVRIVERLENSGTGLNLTYETRDGIKTHRGKYKPHTLEGRVVQISDKIAYVNHDIDDAIRGKILKEEDLPKDIINVLGNTSGERINYLITDVIKNSQDESEIIISDKARKTLYDLRSFMYEKVYLNQKLDFERRKIFHMFKEFHEYYWENTENLPKEFLNLIESGESKDQVIGDFIAGMTDRFSIEHYNQLFMPISWKE